MRILIVSQYFWPESFRINEVAESLRAAGCDVTVLAGQPNYPGGKIFPGYRALDVGWDRRSSTYDLARVPLLPRGSGSALGLVLNYLSFVVSASVFGPWLLRRRQYDVIFVYALSPILQALPAILLKWIKGASLVIWVQDLWPESLQVTGYIKNEVILRLVGALTRWIYRRADLLLGQSRAFVKAIGSAAPLVRVEFYPTPGEVDAAPDLEQPELTLPAGFNIVFAGNLGVAQALPTILNAAIALRSREDIRFVLVGDGSRRAWLASEIERHKLQNIVLPGRYPSRSIPNILSQASALLVTLSRSDAMSKTIPAKISTYLAAGRPIIACLDGEGGSIVLEAGAGIACAAEDSEALAQAAVRLAGMKASVRDRMGTAGRAYFDAHFEPKMLTRRLIGLFNEVLGRVRRRDISNDSARGT